MHLPASSYINMAKQQQQQQQFSYNDRKVSLNFVYSYSDEHEVESLNVDKTLTLYKLIY